MFFGGKFEIKKLFKIDSFKEVKVCWVIECEKID